MLERPVNMEDPNDFVRKSYPNRGNGRLHAGSVNSWIVAHFGPQNWWVRTNWNLFDSTMVKKHARPSPLDKSRWMKEMKEKRKTLWQKFELKQCAFGLGNRLDKETSGCLIVALTQEGCDQLLFHRDNHHMHKEYETFVRGYIDPSQWKGVLSWPLKKRAIGNKGAHEVALCECCSAWFKETDPTTGRNYTRNEDARGNFKCRYANKNAPGNREGWQCAEKRGPTRSFYRVIDYRTRVVNGEDQAYTRIGVRLESGIIVKPERVRQ